MRRLKKIYFISLFWIVVGVLGVVRLFAERPVSCLFTEGDGENEDTTSIQISCRNKNVIENAGLDGYSSRTNTPKTYHPIYSVPSFSGSFPDLQETHIVSAKKWGVEPVYNRLAAEQRKDELVYVGSNPYYKIDPGMNSSIPYLVPHAAGVLQTIAQNYLDSLHVKGIPLHKLLVSSVLRTEEDIERLRKINVNASPESCHRFGTTFDIPYNRYHTVMPPGENRHMVQNDTLKWVLAEVLRDARAQGLCYVKYEVKQGCFHITAR